MIEACEKIHDDCHHSWPSDGPGFQRFIYALDRFLPIINLGQASEFRPRVDSGVKILWMDAGWWLLWLDWFLMLSGWVLTTLWISAITGYMRKVDSDE